MLSSLVFSLFIPSVLSIFSLISTLTLESDEEYAWDFATKDGYLYVAATKVVKINLATFSRVSSISVTGASAFSMALGTDGFLYVGNYVLGTGEAISKINLVTFTEIDTLSLGSGNNYPFTLLADSGFLYAVCKTTPGRIVKINLATFSVSSTLQLASGENGPSGGAISGGFLYVGCSTAPAKIVKINLATFTEEEILPLLTGEDDATALKIKDNFLYVGLWYATSLIVKVNLSTFARVGSIPPDTYGYKIEPHSMGINGAYLYAGTDEYIIKINLTTFSYDSSLDVSLDPEAVLISGIYLYAGHDYSPADIDKIQIAETPIPTYFFINSEPINVTFQINGVSQNAPYNTSTPGNYFLSVESFAISDGTVYYFQYWTVAGIDSYDSALQFYFSGAQNVTATVHFITGRKPPGVAIPFPKPTPKPALPYGINLWLLLLLILIIALIIASIYKRLK